MAIDRDAALELLRRQHTFPGAFEFRVVVRPNVRVAALSAMVAAAGDAAHVVGVDERKSRKGNYLALHVTLHLPDAERVLDVYDVLRGVEGILATM